MTLSTVRMGGTKALMTAGDVPGGKDARNSVGFAAAFSASFVSAALSSSSSEVWNAAAAPCEPEPEFSKPKIPCAESRSLWNPS